MATVENNRYLTAIRGEKTCIDDKNDGLPILNGDFQKLHMLHQMTRCFFDVSIVRWGKLSNHNILQDLDGKE